MRDHKISQVSLAKDMCVTPQYINKILQGKQNRTLKQLEERRFVVKLKLGREKFLFKRKAI